MKKKSKRKPRISMARCRDRVHWLSMKLKREVNPKDVLKDAADRKSPYHSFFEWNDTKAAYEHRLWQARQLLGRIKILYHDQMGNEVSVREYVRLELQQPASHTVRGGYVPRVRAMSNAGLTKQCEEQAIQEQLTWKQRWIGFRAMEAQTHLVDAIVAGIRKFKFRKVAKAK